METLLRPILVGLLIGGGIYYVWCFRSILRCRFEYWQTYRNGIYAKDGPGYCWAIAYVEYIGGGLLLLFPMFWAAAAMFGYVRDLLP
jgi:hypothetical protein